MYSNMYILSLWVWVMQQDNDPKAYQQIYNRTAGKESKQQQQKSRCCNNPNPDLIMVRVVQKLLQNNDLRNC